MPDDETPGATCARCGESIAPGSPLCSDHVRSADGQLRCAESDRALRGRVEPDMVRPDVPVTQWNPNVPGTH